MNPENKDTETHFTQTSLCDTALTAFISYKLEHLLTEVLTVLILVHPRGGEKLKELDIKYNCYRYKKKLDKGEWRDEVLHDDLVALRENLKLTPSLLKVNRDCILDILKRLPLNLGSLIIECSYSSDVPLPDNALFIKQSLQILRQREHITGCDDEYNLFRENAKTINGLRNSIIHFGKRAPPLRFQGEEKTQLTGSYESIIDVDKSIVAKVASYAVPNEKYQLIRLSYHEVSKVDEWRAILDQYRSLEVKQQQRIALLEDDLDHLGFENSNLQLRVDEEQGLRMEVEAELTELKQHHQILLEEKREVEKLSVCAVKPTKHVETQIDMAMQSKDTQTDEANIAQASDDTGFPIEETAEGGNRETLAESPLVATETVKLTKGQKRRQRRNRAKIAWEKERAAAQE